MYTNRYCVTKIARMRVFSFLIKDYSRSTYPQKKSIFLNNTGLKQGLWKDLVRWPEVFFSHRPSITQVRELKIPRRFERWQRSLKMYSRLFTFCRDYFNSQSTFPHHNWFTCSPRYAQIKTHKAIKEKNEMFYYFLWNGKGDNEWSMNLSMEAQRWLNSALTENLLKQHEWKSAWTRLTTENENFSSI